MLPAALLNLLIGSVATYSILIIVNAIHTSLFTMLLAELLGTSPIGGIIAGLGVGLCTYRFSFYANGAKPMTDLVWHSSFVSQTGYSGSSLAFVLGLDARNVAVRPLYLYGADQDEQLAMGHIHPRVAALQKQPLRFDVPQVVYAPADRFSKNSGRYRIGYSMLETDRLPVDWVMQANQMDEIWTTSPWGAEVFQSSGIIRPVYVIPLGIDPLRFAPGSRRSHLTDHTVFLSVFEWGVRKGWDVLLRAYRAAFKANDPVLLLLKIDCHAPVPNPLRELHALLPESSPPVGLLYNQPMSNARLVELYRSADCFVLPTRGEGWGMPILESMACGVPAITTNWSAPATFITAENSYPLPITGLVEADATNPYTHGAHWAAPDEDALVELLRHVANQPEERRRKGIQASQDAQYWTWERAIDHIMERLRNIEC